MLLAVLGRLKDREQANVLSKAGFRSAESEGALGFEEESLEAQKELVGRKMNAPVDAFRFLEKMPLDQIAYLMAESNKSAALSKIRAFLNKWRPVRNSLPVVATELEALGMPRGTKFDQIVEQVFAMQLTGRGKTHEEREKILRKLSGIKEPPKKKEKEKRASTRLTPPRPWATPLTKSTRPQKSKRRSRQPRGNLPLRSPTRSAPPRHLMARALPPARRGTAASSAPVRLPHLSGWLPIRHSLTTGQSSGRGALGCCAKRCKILLDFSMREHDASAKPESAGRIGPSAPNRS